MSSWSTPSAEPGGAGTWLTRASKSGRRSSPGPSADVFAMPAFAFV